MQKILTKTLPYHISPLAIHLNLKDFNEFFKGNWMFAIEQILRETEVLLSQSKPNLLKWCVMLYYMKVGSWRAACDAIPFVFCRPLKSLEKGWKTCESPFVLVFAAKKIVTTITTLGKKAIREELAIKVLQAMELQVVLAKASYGSRTRLRYEQAPATLMSNIWAASKCLKAAAWIVARKLSKSWKVAKRSPQDPFSTSMEMGCEWWISIPRDYFWIKPSKKSLFVPRITITTEDFHTFVAMERRDVGCAMDLWLLRKRYNK